MKFEDPWVGEVELKVEKKENKIFIKILSKKIKEEFDVFVRDFTVSVVPKGFKVVECEVGFVEVSSPEVGIALFARLDEESLKKILKFVESIVEKPRILVVGGKIPEVVFEECGYKRSGFYYVKA